MEVLTVQEDRRPFVEGEGGGADSLADLLCLVTSLIEPAPQVPDIRPYPNPLAAAELDVVAGRRAQPG